MDRFPTTRISAVQGAGSPDREVRERAFATLAAAYWRPVRTYVQLRWGRAPEDAEDLAQGFFLRALEKDFFASFDPSRARFRTFLRVCLDGYLGNAIKAAGREKRGGGAAHLPLDAAVLELPSGDSVERAFEVEWIRSVFELAVARLRQTCEEKGKTEAWTVFSRTDLHEGPQPRPTYAELSHLCGLPVTQVTNHLAWARRTLRRGVLEVLREITATDEEFRAEARVLLGTDAAP